MQQPDNWVDVGAADALQRSELQAVRAGDVRIALSYVGGAFGAIANACNHVGGPLSEGCVDGDFVVCPWHQWKFHRVAGTGEPGYEDDRVPSYPVRVEKGRVLVDIAGATKRQKTPHEPHPLARKVERAQGTIRVVGISTTAMDEKSPRYSGSDNLLASALKTAEGSGCETRLIRRMDRGGHGTQRCDCEDLARAARGRGRAGRPLHRTGRTVHRDDSR